MINSFSINFLRHAGMAFCGVTLTCFFASVAYSADFFERREPVKFEFMQKVSSDHTLGGYPILNIGGEWKLALATTSYSTGMASGIPLGSVYLVDVRDNKFFASLIMRGNLEPANASDWTDEPCKRTNFLWKRSTGRAFSNINCVSIDHRVNHYVRPTGQFQTLLGKFRELNIDLPPTILRIEFTRYSDHGRRLVYVLDVNPEMFGFDRDSEGLWGANSWYKDFSQKDPKKTEFIAFLSKWAEGVQDKMDSAFEKDTSAFREISSLKKD